MATYKVTFVGKPKDVRCPEYSISRVVTGASKWDVLMELYKSYENIHFIEYVLL